VRASRAKTTLSWTKDFMECAGGTLGRPTKFRKKMIGGYGTTERVAVSGDLAGSKLLQRT
jgi:hypothetical protein